DQDVARRLFAIHEVRGDGGALIAIRGRQIDASPDPRERSRLRLDLAARLTEAGRGDAAIEVLRTSLAESPGDEGTVTALGDRRQAEGGSADPTALGEEEAGRREALGDGQGAAASWTRAATVAEKRLGDVLRAIRSYRRAAAFEAPEALTALARLYAASG